MDADTASTAQSKGEKRRLLFENNLITIYLLIKENQPVTIARLMELSTDRMYDRVRMNKMAIRLLDKGMVKRLPGIYPHMYEAVPCDVQKSHIDSILLPVPVHREQHQSLTRISDKERDKNGRITVIGNRTVHLCSNTEPHGDRGR